MRTKLPFLIGMLLLLGACGTAKRGLRDGVYSTREGRAMVQVIDDTVSVRPIGADTMRASSSHPSIVSSSDAPAPLRLLQHSLDVDLLTTLVKFRPAAADQPPQLETHLSGSLYVGYRVDRYDLWYPDIGYARRSRKETHTGLSMGLFLGLGGTSMSPWTTQQTRQTEYTGVVLSHGAALISAIGSVTVGCAVGRDHLLDDNAGSWTHEGRPWLGLVFGLNLN